VNKVIFRHPITTENRVAFPFLYNSRPRSISISPYHYPQSCFISSDYVKDDPFIIDDSISVISQKDPSPEILYPSEQHFYLFFLNFLKQQKCSKLILSFFMFLHHLILKLQKLQMLKTFHFVRIDIIDDPIFQLFSK
jgi:hypothetical protein